ncbi:NADPH-dependent ferric siderophore reductase [Labedella gwakjiensis]|uniref:NADPH-dependent ferric siderophore reductase n=1 Tax=Labedella gwakjiensis TaxID=390269 RepID=A0A2P8GYU0_9MICO|nr:siderophore-interacting protein [Labedella gwakjiensis]PSL39143.1 NADPH-dependent ferric siderophore reductase [Labedella gwakjiensis]RUQ86419.1 siderophore-interacting protein [Labedella gwakjiensis]
MSHLENNGRPWAYSAFRARVSRRRVLSPGFVRMTLAGPDLRNFAPWGLDQRIKLVLPMADGSLADFGLLADPTPHPSDWYARWRALPEGDRNVLRTYTPAAIRPEAGEIDVDVVIHEPPGPASRWALGARIGEEIVLTGPDIRAGVTGYGIAWQPGDARRVLIVGDETAFPAIRNILDALGEDVRAHVLAEVGGTEDDLLSSRRSDSVTVDVRRRNGIPGSGLDDAVRDWAAAASETTSGEQEPTAVADDLYVWIAGEAGSVTRIRRHLADDLGVPKERISFLGYWRHGGPLTS